MGHLFIGLAFFIIAKAYADADTNINNVMSCLELFNMEKMDKMCCVSLRSLAKLDIDTRKCFKEDSEGWTCKNYECILRENGMFKDGKVDDDAVMKVLDKLIEDNPQEKALLNRVRVECLNGKYENYPSDDVCSAMKYYVCTYVNVYLECTSWKTDETCSKMADDAKKCRSALES